MTSSAINFIRRHKRPLAGTLVGMLIAGIAVTAPHVASAGSGFQDAIMSVLANITYALIQFMAKLLVVVINIMVAVAQYSKFLGVDAVEKGWAIVRDVCNMFFIVVLLIIAFGTILRLENYRYNRLLARLIIMAVLVNFSKFIAGFLIDFSQVVMLTFVNAWRDIAAGNFTSALGLQDIVSLSRDQNLDVGSSSNVGAVLTALLLGLALVTIATIVMAIIAIVLVLRILALWFLIVLSPLAFLLKTYPSTEKYAARWWQEFGKYAVTGPVVAFLLWLTLAIIASPTNISSDVFINTTEGGAIVDTSDTGMDARISAAITTIGDSEKLLSYMIGIMLLVGTLVITKELGVAGGQMAGQWADKIKGFATKAAVLGGAAVAGGGLGMYAVTGGKKSLQLAGKAGVGMGKGVLGGIRNKLEAGRWSPLRGQNLNPKEWLEGIHAAGQERRREAIEKRDRYTIDRLQGYTKKIAIRGKRAHWYSLRGQDTGKTRDKYIAPHPLRALTGDMEYGWRHTVPNVVQPWKWGRGSYPEAEADLRKKRAVVEEASERRRARASGVDTGKYYIEDETKTRSGKEWDDEIAESKRRRLANPDSDENYEIVSDAEGKSFRTEKTFEKFMEQAKKDVGGRELTPKETEKKEREWDEAHALRRKQYEERNRLVSERADEMQDEVKKQFVAGGQSIYGVVEKKEKKKKQKDGQEVEEEITTKETFEEACKKIADTNGINLATATADERELIAAQAMEDEWGEKLKKRATDEVGASPAASDPRVAIQERVRKQVLAETPDEEEQRRLGRERLNKKADDLKQQAEDAATAAKSGNLTNAQKEAKQKEVDKMVQELEQIRAELARQKSIGLDETTLRELQRRLNDKEKKKNELQAYKDAGKATTKEDKEGADKDAEKLGRQEKQLREQAKGPAGAEELIALDEEIRRHEVAAQESEAQVTKLRPEVPYNLQRSLRDSINEQKKKLMSDSWHEHAAVMEDAFRRKDLALASAALLRATEYGNENELLNHFGYDQSPEDFRNFIEDKFVKELGMSMTQALSVATDVSYTAEKNKHWSLARTTKVNSASGRMEWQKNDDQQTEVLAEIRKTDFENFLRQGNRLAWGNEKLRGTTREEKMRNFRSSGERDFIMAPYAQALLRENFGKMMRGMNQGRFNVNLAVKILGDSNKPVLDRIAQDLGNRQQYSEGHAFTFKDWLEKVGQFAAHDQEQGEFEILQQILRRVSEEGF